ncbi:Outer membrane cobalamin receptor protein [Pustulibacterium marinum]|uniref:Outer membrane cobalamin receptor protein n=1 Tax=Pustulibacterium marinum TaxID=1224947 RepID=A0A1I7HIW1_9FLAO|nr:TonB-dependent receptor [Pustulibacterium marinum]SFU60406.1 Outer membrane cobalamin receptor protein [Pustulibacterium marinum]
MIKTNYLILIFSICCAAIGFSQTGTVTGKITTKDGETLPMAYVYSKNSSSYYTESDENGKYALTLPEGKHTLLISILGYLKQEQQIQVFSGKTITLNIALEEDPDMLLEDVSVTGKSILKDVQESAFNVVAVDAQPLHNTTLDISQALERVSGVRVRRTGGVGSDMNVMLNGFTGRHVKFFIDGIPMEGFSSAFQLNNIPINLAKRVEVYKGVVPITFGSDALGGAINIVTENGKQNFIDASYSYGSFNTHKSFVNAAYTADSGFTARLTAFQNYSDNDYKVDADILNLDTNIYSGEIREVRRFHDMYRNYTLMGKIGFVNKSFADQLLLGFTWGDEYNQVQHPAYMKIAFGDKYTTSQTLMPNLTYRKKDLFTKNLDVSLSANYNFGENANIDDSTRRYNWLGEYVDTDEPGEFNYTRMFFKNRNGAVNTNVTYTVNEKHAITVNNVLNTFSRKSRNEVEPSAADAYPSETLKNILGLGYKYKMNEKLDVSLFSKYYYNQVGQYADPESDGEYEHLTTATKELGYGGAASYFILENLQAKASYEKAYRLPTARELFGAGNDFELGNTDLKPESSDNFNFGANYNWVMNSKNSLNLDASFIYRDIKDFIRQVVSPSTGTLQPGNEAKVQNRGVDFEARYNYSDFFTAGASFTYQNLRNKLKYRTGRTVVSTIYDDRIPNMPYLYGNADFSFFFKNIRNKEDRLSLSYNLLYIHEFDYSWSSYGGRKIPTQVAHDIYVNYSMKNGKYNVSLECTNILNEDLYDNFSLQKPGRAFAIKLRYFLDKF